MKKVIILGSSGHAKVIIDIFEKEGTKILGLLDSYRAVGEALMGYKILGQENDLPIIINKYPDVLFFLAVGDNWLRAKIKEKMLKILPDIRFTNAIHPSAIIGKNVKLGVGIAIMAGVVINSQTEVGNFTILNTRSSVDHDNKLSDFSSLAPNATTGGYVTIGEFSAISISATIKDRISIGKHSIIGASSLLLGNCEDYVVMYGMPAKKVKTREAGDKYL